MSELLKTKVDLINKKVKFQATAGENPPIITDYVPPFGNLEGYTPLELFLISLSTCLGGTVSLLLQKMQIEVDGLTVDAFGQRREQHPTSFETITLHLSLKSQNGKTEDLQKATELAESKFCPVIAMLNDTVKIVYEYTLENEAAV